MPNEFVPNAQSSDSDAISVIEYMESMDYVMYKVFSYGTGRVGGHFFKFATSVDALTGEEVETDRLVPAEEFLFKYKADAEDNISVSDLVDEETGDYINVDRLMVIPNGQYGKTWATLRNMEPKGGYAGSGFFLRTQPRI